MSLNRFKEVNDKPIIVSKATFWEYQCIDTMKYSRDRARQYQSGDLKEETISTQVKKIASLGANCISIGTPYDNEFKNYLNLWVKHARHSNLRVWFRGNWSGYEQWFDYPALVSLDEHHQKTRQFIIENESMFENDDIFTSAPEPENSEVFKPLFERDANIFRKFIVDSNQAALDSFAKINKKVKTNYISLSGGVANSMLDLDTIKSLDNTVTLDHYVKTPEIMNEYIEHYKSKLNAKVVLGEFGAPIPDINGEMSQSEQAQFVTSILQVLAKQNKTIPAINYWTLSDSSTSLIDDSQNDKQVVEVIKKFYSPIKIFGRVSNSLSQQLSDVTISSTENIYTTTTDKNGNYELIVPTGDEVNLKVILAGYDDYNLKIKDNGSQNIVLNKSSPDILYKIKEIITR
ncbi:MAG: carboxypeptidase-like regulatory domain-containing protein [bacterium]|nr:carboxypeptidase-like regulatory domain-containing protein [bacterium]